MLLGFAGLGFAFRRSRRKAHLPKRTTIIETSEGRPMAAFRIWTWRLSEEYGDA